MVCSLLGSKKEMNKLEEDYLKGNWTPEFLVERSSHSLVAIVPSPPKKSGRKRKGNLQLFLGLGYTQHMYTMHDKFDHSVRWRVEFGSTLCVQVVFVLLKVLEMRTIGK